MTSFPVSPTRVSPDASAKVPGVWALCWPKSCAGLSVQLCCHGDDAHDAPQDHLKGTLDSKEIQSRMEAFVDGPALQPSGDLGWGAAALESHGDQVRSGCSISVPLLFFWNTASCPGALLLR